MWFTGLWVEGMCGVHGDLLLSPFQVRNLARELQNQYFSSSQESTRKVAAELRAILTSVEAACIAHDNNAVSVVCI